MHCIVVTGRVTLTANERRSSTTPFPNARSVIKFNLLIEVTENLIALASSLERRSRRGKAISFRLLNEPRRPYSHCLNVRSVVTEFR